MPKIRILDEVTVTKIAAGEVIERPSSVVKELVENSIDAGADRITIEVKDGGKRYIRVTDNGMGMDREDACLSFERHSTSKIEDIEDLQKIRSLGFRGEALASIASVSKVEMTTRLRGSEIGTRVIIEGGEIKSVKETGCPEGTTVIVKELFYNTPARKKYLRSRRTELAHITETVTRYAIIWHDISFKLIHNDSEVLNAPATSNFLENIVNIYGKEIAKELIELDFKSDEIKVSGYIANPTVTKSDTSYQSIFVNRRWVTSSLISRAVKDGFGRLLMKSRFPIAILNIHIRQDRIDVNVHPTKSQVKFSNEFDVYNSVAKAVENALKREMIIPEFKARELKGRRVIKERAPLAEIEVLRKVEESSIDEFIGKEKDVVRESAPEYKARERLPEMAIIGQILNTYIICQSGFNILIIDQHAAHEKILFERFSKAMPMQTHTQELLTPITLELLPKECGVLNENLMLLKELGFIIEPFGRNTFQVRGVPSILEGLESKESIQNIVKDLTEIGQTRIKGELREKVISSIACHSAFKAGKALSRNEIELLIKELRDLDDPYTCPHGRPTIISITQRELEKKFKRVV